MPCGVEACRQCCSKDNLSPRSEVPASWAWPARPRWPANSSARAASAVSECCGSDRGSFAAFAWLRWAPSKDSPDSPRSMPLRRLKSSAHHETPQRSEQQLSRPMGCGINVVRASHTLPRRPCMAMCVPAPHGTKRHDGKRRARIIRGQGILAMKLTRVYHL